MAVPFILMCTPHLMHMSKEHKTDDWKMWKPEVVSGNLTEEMAQEEHVPQNDLLDPQDSEDHSKDELYDLSKQLGHSLATLFLKMQTVLHIPESSVQEVIQQLVQ